MDYNYCVSALNNLVDIYNQLKSNDELVAEFYPAIEATINEIANTLRMPPIVFTESQVAIVERPVIDLSNHKNINYPHLDFTEYFEHTAEYFKLRQYEEKKLLIPDLRKQLDAYNKSIEDIKGLRSDDMNNYAEQRDTLEKSISHTKAQINSIERIARVDYNDLFDDDKTAVRQKAKQEYDSTGGYLIGLPLEYRTNMLANKSMNSDKAWEFYPTPYDIVDKMIENADIKPGMRILEPSGGKGNILDKLYQKFGDSVILETVELNPTNRMILRLKGYKLIGSDFLELEPTPVYDRILMNPPFTDFNDIAHVRHAVKFLNSFGQVYSIVTKKALGKSTPEQIAFRNDVQEFGKLVVLDKDVMERAERAATVEIMLIMLDKARLQANIDKLNENDTPIEKLIIGSYVINVTNDHLWKVSSIAPLVLVDDNGNKKDFGNVKALLSMFKPITNEEADELRSRSGRGGRESDRSILKRNDTKDSQWQEPRLINARPNVERRNVPERNDPTISKALKEHQRTGVNLAIESMDSTGAFILADGTGAGKTLQQLAVAHHYLKTYPNKSVLIVTMKDDIIDQAFYGDARKLEALTTVKDDNGKVISKGINLEQYMTKTMLLKNIDSGQKDVEKGKIYLWKYSDFSLWNSKTHPIYVALVKAFEKKKKADKDYAAQLFDIEQDYKAGAITKKEADERKRAVKATQANDSVYSDFIKAQDKWIDFEYNAYRKFGNQFSAIIFDECHNLKNYTYYFNDKDIRARRCISLASAVERRLFCSATPADRANAIFYMKYAGLFDNDEQMHKLLLRIGFEYHEPVYNERNELVRHSRYTLPGEYDKALATRAIDTIFEDMTEEGRMVKREIEMNNITLEITNVDTGSIARSINQKIIMAAQNSEEKKSLQSVYMDLMRAVEPFKIKQAFELAEKELAQGRSVVIFAGLVEESNDIKDYGGFKSGTVSSLYKMFSDKYGADKVGLLVGDGAIKGADKKTRADDIRKFQLGQKRIIIGTASTGGTGINLDDSDQYDENGDIILEGGYLPRSMIVLTAPMNAEGNVQMIGRINRASTRSRSRVLYVFDFSISIEEWIASIVKSKMAFLNAVVAGQTSKMDIGQMEKVKRVYDSEDEAEAWVEMEDKDDDGDDSKKKKKFKPHRFAHLRLLNKDTTGIDTAITARYEEDSIRKTVTLFIKTTSRAATMHIYEQFKTWFDEHGYFTVSDRYEGTKIQRTYDNSGKAKEFIRDDWNWICNLFLPESGDYIESAKQLYNEGDSIRNIDPIPLPPPAVGVVEKNTEGRIIKVRPVLIDTVQIKGQPDKDIYRYYYDVDFSGTVIKRVEQYVLASNNTTMQVEKISLCEIVSAPNEQRAEFTKILTDIMSNDFPYPSNEAGQFPRLTAGEMYYEGITVKVKYTAIYRGESTLAVLSRRNDGDDCISIYDEDRYYGEDKTYFKRFLANFFENNIDTWGAWLRSCINKALSIWTEPMKTAGLMDNFSTAAVKLPKTLKQMISIPTKPVKLSGKIQTLLGKLNEPFGMMVWGKTGQGKSSFALLLANTLAQNGKVLYFMNEEILETGRVSERCRNLGISEDNIEFEDSKDFDRLIELLNTDRYKFCIIDSVNELGDRAAEMIDVIQEFDNINFVMIAHSDKAGKAYIGDRRLSYIVSDTIINVDELKATTDKHRDGAGFRTISILEPETDGNSVVRHKRTKYRIPNIYKNY